MLCVCVVLVAALLVVTTPALAEGTTVVHGVLTDNAVVKKAVTGASVTVAGIPATVSGQSYMVAGVPTGQQTIVVSAPRHVTLTQTTLVLPGDNTVDLSLGLTATETYLRYFDSYNHWRYRIAYKMLHPDVRAHYPYARYYKEMWFWTHPPFLSTRILSVRTLAKWRPVYLHKTYADVKAIESVRPYKWEGRIVTDRGVGHWVEISGRWYRISDWR
jgi:hypothetical protein